MINTQNWSIHSKNDQPLINTETIHWSICSLCPQFGASGSFNPSVNQPDFLGMNDYWSLPVNRSEDLNRYQELIRGVNWARLGLDWFRTGSDLEKALGLNQIGVSVSLMLLAGTHRRLRHVSSLGDVLAVFLVRHADPLFGHHLVFFFFSLFFSLFLETFLLVFLLLLLSVMFPPAADRLGASLSCLRTQKTEAPPPGYRRNFRLRVKLTCAKLNFLCALSKLNPRPEILPRSC